MVYKNEYTSIGLENDYINGGLVTDTFFLLPYHSLYIQLLVSMPFRNRLDVVYICGCMTVSSGTMQNLLIMKMSMWQIFHLVR